VLSCDLEPGDDLVVEGRGLLQRLAKRVAVGLEQRVEELRLAGEVAVEGAGRQARAAGDVGQARARVAAGREGVAAGGQEGVPGGEGLGVRRGGDDKLPSGFHDAQNDLLTGA
jgi:hypothetical protein